MSDRLARTLASRLREERRRSGLSLRALAERAALSTTTVHQIEAGRGSPSLATLHALAASLDVSLPDLLAPRTTSRTGTRTLAARSRPFVLTEHGALARLAAGLPDQRLHGLVLALPPGASTGREPMTHAGQELVFGLSGTILYEVDGEAHRVGPGDSLVIDSRRPHRARNPGRRAARVLLVLYVPGASGARRRASAPQAPPRPVKPPASPTRPKPARRR